MVAANLADYLVLRVHQLLHAILAFLQSLLPSLITIPAFIAMIQFLVYRDAGHAHIFISLLHA